MAADVHFCRDTKTGGCFAVIKLTVQRQKWPSFFKWICRCKIAELLWCDMLLLQLQIYYCKKKGTVLSLQSAHLQICKSVCRYKHTVCRDKIWLLQLLKHEITTSHTLCLCLCVCMDGWVHWCTRRHVCTHKHMCVTSGFAVLVVIIVQGLQICWWKTHVFNIN